MKVLVTGRAGSGKSAVTNELKRRGHVAFDTDQVAGLSSWRDRQTDELVVINDNSYVDLEKLHWVWNETQLRQLLAENKDLFVCGGADNDLSFYQYFDKQCVLNVSPEIQTKRIQTRTNNDYGKDPTMLPRILAKQQTHVAEAVKLGAVSIDADQPIQRVVDEILEKISDN